MEKLLKEIIEGKKAYEDFKKKKRTIGYYIPDIRGKGSKQYVIKRLDLLREQLLELKKEWR